MDPLLTEDGMLCQVMVTMHHMIQVGVALPTNIVQLDHLIELDIPDGHGVTLGFIVQDPIWVSGFHIRDRIPVALC